MRNSHNYMSEETLMGRLLIGSILIVGFTLLGCATTTKPTTSLNDLSNDEIKAYNSDPNNTDRIVCEYKATVGTRIKKKTCYRESAMRKRSQSDQEAIQDLQRSASLVGE